MQAVITQNVDRLHAAAGSRDVIEVHGSIGSAVCLSCGHGEEDVRPLLPLPRCAHCGAVLKPGVVMFGELLPVDAIDRAQALAESAELLLVVGTSLEVWPVAGLPGATLEHGGRLAIVNRDPTPYDAAGRARRPRLCGGGAGGVRSYDVVVVGSGFGGAVAALRLTEKGYRVAVLEEGRRFEPQDFPRTSWHVRDYLWAPRLGCRGIQRITPLRDVLVLSGAGVGGGSLVYANTLYEPPASVWSDPDVGRRARALVRAGAPDARRRALPR